MSFQQVYCMVVVAMNLFIERKTPSALSKTIPLPGCFKISNQLANNKVE